MASNPFGITQVDVPGLLQTYAGLQQQSLENRYRQGQLARQEKLDSRADEVYNRGEAVRKGLADAYDPATGKIDPGKARNAFLTAGDVEGVMSFDDRELSRQKGEIEQYKAINDTALGLLNSARDQASYSAAIASAKALYDRYGHGQHFPDLPSQYDPKVVEALQAQTEEGRKFLEMRLKQAQAEEVRRHNRATEGTAAAGIRVRERAENRQERWGKPSGIIIGGIPGGIPTDNSDLDY